MRVDGIGTQFHPAPVVEKQDKPGESSFGDTIKEAISKVNELQTEADQLATRLAAGDAVEIHQAMIAMQKASTALAVRISVSR